MYDLVPGDGAPPHSDTPSAVVLDLTALHTAGDRPSPHVAAIVAAARAKGAALWVLAEAPPQGRALPPPHDPALRATLAPLSEQLALERAHAWHDAVGPVRAWVTTAARGPAVCPAVCAAWWQAMVAR